MKKWESIDQIETHYSLRKTESLSVLRSQLRSRLKPLHPDATGGKFESAEQSEQYQQLESAIEFVDAKLSENLPVESQALMIALREQQISINELITRNQDTSAKILKEQRLVAKEEALNDAIVKSVKDEFSTFKYGGGAISILSALFATNTSAFVEMINALTPLASAKAGAYLGLFSALVSIYAGCLAFIVWRREQREISRQLEMTTESGFRRFIHSPQFRVAIDYDGEFSLNDLIVAIKSHTKIKNDVVAQEVAEFTCEKLVQRELTEKLEGVYLSPKFKLNAGLRDELLYD